LQYLAAVLLPLLAPGFILLVDLPDHAHSYSDFPSDVATTTRRPDILLLNRSSRAIYLVELTVPFEENLVKAANLKRQKYDTLVRDIEAGDGWRCRLLTIEVGSRGVLTRPVSSLLNGLASLQATRGVSTADIKQASLVVSQIALRCSFYIYLSRSSTHFDIDRPLLSL
jgi:hypothetical protein